jgi:hypothetical protein
MAYLGHLDTRIGLTVGIACIRIGVGVNGDDRPSNFQTMQINDIASPLPNKKSDRAHAWSESTTPLSSL